MVRKVVLFIDCMIRRLGFLLKCDDTLRSRFADGGKCMVQPDRQPL